MTDLKPMGMNNTDRELGILRAEVDHLKKDLDEVKQDVKEILKSINQDQGGKATLFKLLAAASAIGSLVGTAFGILIKLFA